jgi:hypothetical protein
MLCFCLPDLTVFKIKIDNMNILLKKLPVLFFLVCLSSITYGQESITIKNLKVMEMMSDPDDVTADQMLVEFEVNDISLVANIHIILEESLLTFDSKEFYLQVHEREGIYKIFYKGYWIPVQGNKVQVVLEDLVDQFDDPYAKVSVQCLDSKGNPSNLLVQER